MEVFEKGQGDPVAIAREAVDRARYYGMDPVIIDTAGRLHIDENLMQELRDVKAAVKPQEILLVVDAMTGQDAVTVADTFNDNLGIDGVILTKLDGDTRGGAAISVRAVTGKPIKFCGHRGKAGRHRALPSGPHGFPHSGHGRRDESDRKGAGHL